MEPTNVDRALAALEEQHAGDPERVELLRRTRRFKASWLELGQALAEIKRSKSWERWGYDAFETYAKNELKLRPETVDKLCGSYMFLNKRAPEVLKRDPLDAPMPSYQAIDYLRRAEEKAAEPESTVTEETMQDVRKRILDDNTPLATVARLYNDTLFPVTDSDKRTKNKAQLKATAVKLRELLGDTEAVPKRLANTVGESLDELIAHLGAEAKAA